MKIRIKKIRYCKVYIFLFTYKLMFIDFTKHIKNVIVNFFFKYGPKFGYSIGIVFLWNSAKWISAKGSYIIFHDETSRQELITIMVFGNYFFNTN